jgi:hypothetical protein
MTNYGSIMNTLDLPILVPPKCVKDGLSRAWNKPRGFSESKFPIPTGQGYGEAIYVNVSRAYYSKVGWEYEPNTAWPHSVRSEVYRFYMCLLAYYESPNPSIPPAHLLSLIKREADGIEYLKKTRSFSVVRAMRGWHQDVDPSDKVFEEESKRYPVRDIGDFFNVRFWLFFDQPDPHDELVMFEPLPGINKNMYTKFEDTCMGIIPELFLEAIQEEEILMDLSGSSALLGDKTVPLWAAKQKENYFSSKPLFGKMSYIQKCPGDTRLPLVLSAPHSNSIKLIEKQVALLAAEMPWSCYVKDQAEYFKRFRKFGKNTFFYNRDVKKDGLTKNRKLIQIICSVIKRKYPSWPATKYMGIFDNFYVSLNGEIKNPPRGIGLGMTSALSTILQCVLFRMTLDDMIEKDLMDQGSMDALFYHDDCSLGSSSEETLEELKDADFKTLSSFGIPVAIKKSFTAQEYVLCENYSDDILDTKDSYQRAILKSIHASENITHAKFTWYSMFRYSEPELWSKYIDELVSHFGYEFYPQESRAPALLGGWIPYMYEKVDISLARMGRLPYKTEIAASLTGVKTIKFMKGKRRFRGEYSHPVKKLYPFAKDFGKSRVFLDGYDAMEVASHFTRLNKIGLTSAYWQEQFEFRHNKYHSFMDGPGVEYREWIREIRLTHPTLDILPHIDLCQEIDVEQFPYHGPVYRPENRKISYLKALNPGALSDKIIPFPVPPDIELGSVTQLTAFERTRVQVEPHFYGRSYGEHGEIQLVHPESRLIYSQEWFNPMSVVAATLALTHREYLPKFEDRTGDIASMSRELFYSLNNPNHPNLFVALVPRLGYERVKNLDLTYFEEEVNTLLQKRRLDKLKQVYKTVLETAARDSFGSDDSYIHYSEDAAFVWTDASLHDSDFFNWRTSNRNYTNWRNHFFDLLDQKVNSLEIDSAGFLNRFEEIEVKEDYILEGVELHLYLSSGGIVDDNNIPILHRPDTFEGSQSGMVGFDPLAPGSNSSGSEGGLMAGW